MTAKLQNNKELHVAQLSSAGPEQVDQVGMVPDVDEDLELGH